VEELLTERLRLRLWRDEDLPDLRRLDRDPRFMRFFHPQGELRTEEETVGRLAWLRQDWVEHGFGRWAVEERVSGRFVGHAGLAMHRLWPDDPELGYGVDPQLWGRGYGTEAAGAALAHGLETLAFERIVSLIHPENAASIRVAERLGARPIGSVHWPEGGTDVLVYAVERD
jgi:RimJ/RimL family protein N-acetyltransferase